MNAFNRSPLKHFTIYVSITYTWRGVASSVRLTFNHTQTTIVPFKINGIVNNREQKRKKGKIQFVF